MSADWYQQQNLIEEQMYMNDMQTSNQALAVIDNGPAKLLEIAVNKDLDIEKLKELMVMQWSWQEDKAKRDFNAAMCSFQKNCPIILKEDKANNGKYAKLATITQTIADVLSDCGLYYRWEQEEVNGKIGITCIVSHVSGHSERVSLSAPNDKSGNKQELHAIASTISYLRRYSLTCVLGIATADLDDDGNAGQKHVVKPAEPSVAPKVTYIDQNKVGELLDLLTVTETLEADFCKHIKIAKLEEMPSAVFDKAKALLVKKQLTKAEKANVNQ